EIIDLSTILSYEKSIKELKRDGSKCNLSRQTVMNTLKKTDDIESYKIPKTKKKTDILYIEADEDHIHLQNGKNAIVKLVYVHEGKETTGDRNALKNPKYFSGIYEGEETEDLWKDVWTYIKDTYEEESIKKIYITGDGADWIRFGAEYLPNAIYVLDLFHLQKYITAALKNDKKSKRDLWRAILKKDREKVNEILIQKHEELKTDGPNDPINKCLIYINNNWDGICAYKDYQDEITGCSAESHVSHILSERLSRGPISWSKEGAHKMAKLRAVKADGISLKDAIIKQQINDLKPVELPKETIKRAKKKINKIYSQISNIDNLPVLLNKRTFTSMAIRSLLHDYAII
ncbi:ISLre2 family transposase, partial [Calorimonas adulescens]